MFDLESEKDDYHPQVWKVPQTFVRETHKYWVNESRLGDLLTVCAGEAPLLAYEENSGLLRNVDDHTNLNEDFITKRFGSKVTSVYFDSPDFMFYRKRLARAEGANLVRVRWYNKQPKYGQILFLELKTHHESWVVDQSVKERVEILERDMRLLLQRDNDDWGWDYAESIAVAAKKDLTDEQLAKAARILLRIRDLVVQHDLRPCVRTSYTRTAFQSSRSNDLRLTVDEDIRVSDETGAPPGHWFAPDHPGKATVLIPCPVFEVKLAGRSMPSSFESLILNGAIKSGHKFSKFITGVSVLNVDSPHVTTLPYWAVDPLFKKLYTGPIVDPLDPESRESARDDIEEGNIPWSAPVQALRRRFNERKGNRVIANKHRARIEPKSYFAAERTFIQWISAALLLVTVAAFLNAFSVPSTYATEAFLLVLASTITLYSLVIYFRRLYLLENAKPYGYQDHIGPVVLALTVFIGICTILSHSVAIKNLVGNEDSVVAEPMSCVPHKFEGISMLEFQPSDIILDTERGMFIIPSTTDIKGLAKNMNVDSQEKLTTLAVAGRADFEAVTLGKNGTLYAVSEHPTSSSLMAFRWPGDGRNTLELIGQWKLNEAANVEGMAYIPGELVGGKPPRLLVSADARDPLSSNVLVFELPTEFDLNGDTLFEANRLNAGLLSAGLGSAFSTISSVFDSHASTRISAMAEFEGAIYILHDNARTVRGWNLETGSMIAEFITPRAGRGSNRQWEGIFLERAIGGSVVLHMALDTPAEIWSFYLEEKDSGFALPPCARAF